MFLISLVALLVSLGGYYLSNHLLAREYLVHEGGIILISGASTGIGHHAAVTLAEKGYHVFAGVRKEKDVEMIKQTKQSNLYPIILDVSEHDSCVNAMNFITQETKRLNLPFIALVNNAGVSRKLPSSFMILRTLSESLIQITLVFSILFSSHSHFFDKVKVALL